MNRIWRISLVSVVALLLASSFYVSSSYGVPDIPPRPDILSGSTAGILPIVDGNPSEWQNQPVAIEMTNPDYPIHTYVYFVNDSTYLYVLVDVVGDTTNGPSCDECLLEFGSFPTTDIEAGLKDDVITRLPSPFPSGGLVQISFRSSFNSATPHRIYELRIPLSYIGASAGGSIDFSSPSVKGICPSGSIPYDGGDGGSPLDNVYPYWLNQSDINTYARLNFADPVYSVPAMTDWGLILFVVLAGVGSAYYLRKKKKIKNS